MTELQDLHTNKLIEDLVDDVDVSDDKNYNKKLKHYENAHKKIKEFHDDVMKKAGHEDKKIRTTIEINSSEKVIDALKAKRQEYLDSQKSKKDKSDAEPTAEKQTVSQENKVDVETEKQTVQEPRILQEKAQPILVEPVSQTLQL